MIHPAFWSRKRVLVTGHTGFKGAWLSLWLQRMGAIVRGYALPPDSDRGLFTLTKVASRIDSVIGDIRDLDRVRSEITDFSPEIVFHLAAQALVRQSYADPVGTFATNVMGTVHLLEAARSCEAARAIVVITSDKCYENHNTGKSFREDDRLGGDDPYSSSKACSELVTGSYRQSFFSGRPVGLASARAGNVIGGGDWSKDRLIPDGVRAFLRQQPIEIRNPGSTRPWQHVLDPLCGYLTLAEKLWEKPSEFSSAWNFGPPDASFVAVSKIADWMVSRWPSKEGWKDTSNGKAVHEARLLQLDSSRAQNALGWKPALSLDDALSWTLSWYQEMAKGGEAEFTDRQIERYETMVGA